MSSGRSWPTTRANTFDSDSEIEAGPSFEQPEHFRRTPDGWYCNACTPESELQLSYFDASEAIKHEKTAAHKDAVASCTKWGPVTDTDWGLNLGGWGVNTRSWGVQVDNWGMATDNLSMDNWGVNAVDWGFTLQPYSRLRESALSSQVPLRKRVKRWIRDMARAEGIDFEDEEDLDNDDINDWTQWGAGGEDWKRPQEEWGFPVGGLPPLDEEADPRASADFKFVEKIAKKRGLIKDRRRLHAFYRLPTDEKISRIQEIVRFIHTH